MAQCTTQNRSISKMQIPLKEHNEKNRSDALRRTYLGLARRSNSAISFIFFTAKDPQEAFERQFPGHPRNLQNDANVNFPLRCRPCGHQRRLPSTVDANAASGWILTPGDSSRGLSFSEDGYLISAQPRDKGLLVPLTPGLRAQPLRAT